MIIALDGPAASGKGTLARRLAAHYGLPHLDTGLLYRAVGMAVLRDGGEPTDVEVAERAALNLRSTGLADAELRGDRAARAASVVSAIPAVRAALLRFQRDFAAQPGGAVLDGRDIGTIVCPAADAKLFVTASPQVRAQRRHKELLGRGEAAIYAQVLRDIRQRDERDSRRAVAPLAPAVDAFVLDTSALGADEAFRRALAFVEANLGDGTVRARD